ncbi:MFS transporter [Bacillus luteolus]|uniref:MFS transporter n=1 Tax=Litchfieldia luteola TaxID=682179 RepID=A0ABR9QL92_9BACI|nr:MFS transporter [Cytobacillus luteolus]MBE4909280.1 MFS transporter [Cytobacillus luteolus]MBP1940674.1 putative MFS family arabinose efflux permease [Cytobacillus luteolus]
MRLLFVAVFLVFTGISIASNIYTLIPIYHDISLDLNISSTKAVLASSVFSFCYAIGLLMFGPMSEKFGRKLVIVLGLLCSSITTIIVGLSTSEWLLYLSRGLQGIALATFAPVAFSYTFDLFPAKPRTLVLALINSGFLMAGILGQLVSSFITDYLSWEYVFYFFGLVYFGLFGIGCVLFPKHVVPSQSREVLKNMIRLLKNSLLIKSYLITFTLLLTFVAFYDGITRYLTNELQVESEVLFAIRGAGLLGAVLSLFTGKIIAAVGEMKTLKLGLCLTICSLFPLIILPSPKLIAILSIFFVASISLLLPSIISFIGKNGGEHRGSALSIYSFTLLTGASLGPVLAEFLLFNKLVLLLIGLFTLNLIVGSKLKIKEME